MQVHGERQVGSIFWMWSESESFSEVSLVGRCWKDTNLGRYETQQGSNFYRREISKSLAECGARERTLCFHKIVLRCPEREALIKE